MSTASSPPPRQHWRPPPKAEAAPEKPLRAVRPSEIEQVQEALLQADLSGIVRRQPVCALTPGAPPQPVWHEVYVSVADLARLVAPGVDLGTNRWLFQHLTETLDRRVLSLLPRWTDAVLEGRLSINLNLSTVLSPAFPRLQLRAQGRHARLVPDRAAGLRHPGRCQRVRGGARLPAPARLRRLP